jgi:hypothetical protein
MERKIHVFTMVRMLAGPMLALLAWSYPSTGWCGDDTFEAAKRAVLQYFQAIPEFRSTDLINRAQVKPLLDQLDRSGFTLPDRKKILARVPAPGEFLVEQLSTPDGRRFMRRVANYPEAYDRLDRLSRLPHGKQTIRDLIRGPGGEKMIQYLTTAPGGKEMGKMLSESPDGAEFNAATGRIYTVDLLLRQVKKSLAAAPKPGPAVTSPDATPSP